jgi:membrane protein
MAGGVAFFATLALFPAITAVVSLYGFVADTRTILDQLSIAKPFLPQGAYQLIADQVTRVAEGDRSVFGVASTVSMAAAIWSANAGTKAVVEALNVVDDTRESRGIFRLNLFSLLSTLAAVVVVVAVLGAVVLLPILPAAFEIELPGSVDFLKWVVLFVLVLSGISLCYRFGPANKRARPLISVGSLGATLLWVVTATGVTWYISNFANYTVAYGSLGAVFGLMIWMWVSCLLVLLGYALDEEIRSDGSRRYAELGPGSQKRA